MFLVVFRNRKRADNDAARYAADADAMEPLAREQPGYLGFKSYTAEDGEVVALSEWAHEAAAQAWRHNLEHAAIQARGRELYYADYTLFACPEPHVRRFVSDAARGRAFADFVDHRDRSDPRTDKSMLPTLYGIPNCDTVRKARGWLDDAGIAYAFHDYKKLGIDPASLAQWAAQVGWERLLNRGGTTLRKLPEEARTNLDQPRAIALMVAYPSAIRRPIVKHANGLLVGFDPSEWHVLSKID